MKIVVFDLDETLGYFTQFGIFWDSLSYYVKQKNKNELTQKEFNVILNLYPEYLRPNIINILNYLKKKKKSNCCYKMLIYTNNTGPREWAKHILSYFENKINYKLIDQIIAAYKINGKQIELCRTTYNKTYKDLIKCTKIPINSEICFMDDNFYPHMKRDNIYYINIKPYYYDLSFEEILKRFKASEIGKNIIKNDEDFDKLIMENIRSYNYKCLNKNDDEYEIDKILGKNIINHLHKFFNYPLKQNTIKNKNNKNKTKKLHH
jgi:hypothetical protein